ncbi:MAG: tRNA dihydrouridine synthase DusB [Clostridia bacterium]
MRIGSLEIENNVFLAPMAGVTDQPFRLLCKEMGCGVVYTEMVGAKGLHYGGEQTRQLIDIHPLEHPVGIQIFGSEPEIMAMIAEQLNNEDADLIDINMGCPAPKIVKNNEGCALMKDMQRAEKVIRAVVKASKKPVTVKFRKGWDDSSVNAVEFAQMAEEAGVQAVTVHGRTREQFYSGRADWDIIRKVKGSVGIPVIGNGDIFSGEAARRMFEETGCDGVMVARGAQGNPWIFAEIRSCLRGEKEIPVPGPGDKIDMALRHGAMMMEYKGEYIAIREMRKHISWYLKGIKNASQLKVAVNSAQSWEEMKALLLDFKKTV